MSHKQNYVATHIRAASILITLSVHFAFDGFIILTVLGEGYKLRNYIFQLASSLSFTLYKNCFSHYILKHTEFVFIPLRQSGHAVA
jgi:hypothetical protein